MRREIKATVYNSRILQMSLHQICRRIFILASLICISCEAVGQAPNWQIPEQQLAAKISAVTGPGAVSIEFSNRSSLIRSQEEDIQRGLLRELSILGLRVVNIEAAAANIKISLSENLQQYVWVAQILQGRNEPAVVMVSFPRGPSSRMDSAASAISLRRNLLWSQTDRILDAAALGGTPQQLIVLDENGVTLYQMQGGHWQVEQSLPLHRVHPWPRDLRGRLVLRKDHLFDVYLPGFFCRSTSNMPLALTCHESEDPWPLGDGDIQMSAFFAPTRNFFTGALMPGVGKQTSAPAFFSAAGLPRDRYTLWLFTGTDGALHMLDGFTDQIAKVEWGSDITAVHSGCGSGWQILTSAKGSEGNDAIRMFDMPDREPFAVGQPTEFHGEVTALWTQTDGNSAVVVLHDSARGEYEAYQLALACD